MTLDGSVLPICEFLTSVNVDNAFSDAKRASGNDVIDVDSRCSVDKEVHEETFVGRPPATHKDVSQYSHC